MAPRVFEVFNQSIQSTFVH